MICVSSEKIRIRARELPIGYLAECQASAKVVGGQWCFEHSAFFRIRDKYKGFAPSSSETRDEGVPISGCCDRADQY